MAVRYTTAGESHGKALIALVEGIPAGVEFSTDILRAELAKRRGGIGRGERQKFERDEVTILSGVLQGRTIASPIAILIENTEWAKWEAIMSPDASGSAQICGVVASDSVESVDGSGFSRSDSVGSVGGSGFSRIASQHTQNPGEFAAPNVPKGEEFDKLMRPRPGHADLEGIRKYEFENARPVLERASARETAARVAAGAVAKAFLKQFCGVEVLAEVVQFAGISRGAEMTGEEFDLLAAKEAQKAVAAGETLGGIVEIRAVNVPPGLGSYISASERLDGRLAGALMGVQAVKGVEIGAGFASASTPGSLAHDPITPSSDFARSSNNAGGIEGGISNGEEIICRIAVKPIPSVPGGLPTVDLATGEPARGHSQRSDCSAVYPARIVAEAAVALVLADAVVSRFGGDNLQMMKRLL